MEDGTATFEPKPLQYAQSALADMKTAQTAQSATKPFYGINLNPHNAAGTNMDDSLTRVDRPCAGTSSAHADAPARTTTTNALGAVTLTMAHRDVPAVNQLLQRRHTKAVTPYHIDGWQHLLSKYDLNRKYPSIVDQLSHGFIVRCHAPNMFGTVNMECTVDSRLSWSE